MVRSAYGVLQVVFQHETGAVWNPLYGSVVAFALMALLTEYIAVGIFFYVGFSMMPDRGVMSVAGGRNDEGSNTKA